jgi:hypothetical protein
MRAIIKQELETINPKNLTEFEASVKKILNNIDHSTIRSLIESMPSRIEKLIALNGDITEY